MVRSKIEALVLPIFRRYWLWTAVERPNGATTALNLERINRTRSHAGERNVTLEDKFQRFGQRWASRAQARLMAEWNKLENAKEGTFRNYGYRLAQAVLSREDPQESFLKSVPTGAAQVEIKYPSSFEERLVRRRLRLLAHQGHKRHRLRFVLWIFALIPQLPLMLTPLPNITVYYTAYRVFSHYRAFQGSKALERGFAALDTAQLGALRDQLLRVQSDRNLIYDSDSWPARLIRKEKRYLDIFENMLKLQRQHRLEMKLKDADLVPDDEKHEIEMEMETETNIPPLSTGTQIQFSADAVLDSLIFHGSDDSVSGSSAPQHDYQNINKKPLEDDVAMKIGKSFDRPNLLEMIARARRRAVGSMFPARSDEWKVW
jgi:hypothetical protein